MRIGNFKLIRELRDLPVVETANALHVKHIGVLDPLQKTATEHMVLDNFIEKANTAYLQTRLGGDDSAGLGVSMATLVVLPAGIIFFFFPSVIFSRYLILQNG